MRNPILAAVAAVLLMAPAATMAARPAATPTQAVAATQASLIVESGSGRVVTLPAPVANVFVSDPKVVEVRPASPTSLFLFGVAAGRTTVAALDAAGQTVRQYEVTVRPSAFGATEATGTIARTTPGGNVRVEAQPRRVAVTGKVASAADSQSAAAAAAAFAAEGQAVDNQLRVGSQIQVGLHVRIAEMSRSVSRAMGVNWQALGTIGSIGALPALTLNANAAAAVACLPWKVFPAGRCPQGASVNGLIDALAADNLVHVLAEPNLTAISGETASFLVGGEFPIPISQQNGSTTVEFKQFGVALAFVPTVLGEERIRLHVRPEVSQLSSQNSVQVSSGGAVLSIPSLTVRRADTTIELGSGQSFAIAGLLQDQTTQVTSAIPGIGDMPILGALFRSDSFQRNETELVIIVTPYIVRPVNDPSALKLPTDGFQPPNDIERLLLLRQTARSATGMAQRVPSQAGFVVE
ncbi:type II and III secretion system protein family protein [Limobrevibacterium gyesilva]|uniref:Type II and III secretion system protein family protein n=1 Tax=Limobrevibacterium gyesilva TaxID=2991712 RepID=A0AA41YUU4_9PROT|nr:type II and III secretion system protein family protein [Limobrevibacterium gyesilva]MCW3475827.1 type II and III secretion system protein family protein [Limobrevibacterium gyesilva]